MFTKSPHKHENSIVVGVEYEHPKHEGNGLNLMIKHNHDEHIFYVHSIQVGTDLTYNKYSNTI